ncbi:unnamed protein product, partial [Iphiclides podalirius]
MLLTYEAATWWQGVKTTINKWDHALTSLRISATFSSRRKYRRRPGSTTRPPLPPQSAPKPHAPAAEFRAHGTYPVLLAAPWCHTHRRLYNPTALLLRSRTPDVTIASIARAMDIHVKNVVG